MKVLATTVVAALAILAPVVVSAQEVRPDLRWSSLAADRSAHDVGDVLTVLVYETSSATSSVATGTDRGSSLSGSISGGGGLNESGALGLDSGFEARGAASRSGRMVAQVTVVVEEVLANGDLRIRGGQVLTTDGERASIRLEGRVRRADVQANNTIQSNRIADAVIDYEGAGVVSRGARPSIISRVLGWFGLP